MQKTTQLEIAEVAQLVTILKEAKKPIPRTELLKIVNDERRLTRRLDYIKETFTNLYLIYVKEGYRLVNKRSYSYKATTSKKNKPILHIGADIYSSIIAKFIAEIEYAKSKNRQLKIEGYKSVSGNSPKKYVVSVVDFDFTGDPFIYATTDDEPNKIKTFKLSRADNFTCIKHAVGFAKNVSIKNLQRDDFGFILPENTTCKVATLLMTTYAVTMLVHDFPHLNEKIEKLSAPEIIKDKVNETDYEYIYSIKISYSNIKPLGRVVTGLLDHIKVYAEQSTLDELSEFTRKTVINSIAKNLIKV